MDLFPLFPQTVAKVRLENHKKLKETFATNLIEKHEAVPDQKMDWAKYCHSWQEDATPYESILLPELRPHINTWLDHFHYPNFDYILSSWFNVHSCDMYQETHRHMEGAVVICGIYYLQLSDKDSPVVFTPHSDQYQSHINNLNLKPDHGWFADYSEPMLDIREGDLVLFTPDAQHFVPKAKEKHDGYRITLSFNIVKS